MATKAPKQKQVRITAEMKAAFKARRKETGPQIDQFNYKVSMMKALSHHNTHTDAKVLIASGREYAKQNGIDLSGVSDAHLALTYGAVANMILNDAGVSDEDASNLQAKLLALSLRFPKKKEVAVKKVAALAPKVSASDKNSEHASALIASIDGAFDALMEKEMGRADTPISDLIPKTTPPAVVKLVHAYVSKRLAEFQEVREGEDPQVVEGYSNIARRKLNHIMSFLEEGYNSTRVLAAVKTVRKARARKEKPASVVVAKLRYMKECPEFKLKSLDPKELVGARMVTLFNAKYRILTVLHAVEGNTLTVKGTSIVNFDPTKSVRQKLRKPETQLKEFVGQGLRNTATALKSLTTKPAEGNGRMSEEVLIISVVK